MKFIVEIVRPSLFRANATFTHREEYEHAVQAYAALKLAATYDWPIISAKIIPRKG